MWKECSFMKNDKRVASVVLILFILTSAVEGKIASDTFAMGTSAEALAMGQAWTAEQDMPGISFYNPAGLSAVETLNLSYFTYLINGVSFENEVGPAFTYSFFEVSGRMGKKGEGPGASFQFYRYGLGEFKTTSELGEVLGTRNISVNRLASAIGYGFKNKIALGAGVNWDMPALAETMDQSFSLDLGSQYYGKSWSLGLTGETGFNSLSVNSLRAGGLKRFLVEKWDFQANLDLEFRQKEDDPVIKLGTRIKTPCPFLICGGMNYSRLWNDSDDGNFSWSAGLGYSDIFENFDLSLFLGGCWNRYFETYQLFMSINIMKIRKWRD